MPSVCRAGDTHLDGDGQRGGVEVPFHQRGHSLRGAEKIGHLVWEEVPEAFHRPQRTHQHIWELGQGTQPQGSGTRVILLCR